MRPPTFFPASSSANLIYAASSNLGEGCVFDVHGKITIGPDAFLGHEVMILTSLHDYMLFGAPRMRSCLTRPVVVEEGAWICSRAILCPGITVGAHAVVAAGAVVMRNVAPYTLVGGNPARFIRRLKTIKGKS